MGRDPGVSLEDDLLSKTGFQVAVVVDLPPLDALMGLVSSQTPEMIEQALGGIGILVEVKTAVIFGRFAASPL